MFRGLVLPVAFSSPSCSHCWGLGSVSCGAKWGEEDVERVLSELWVSWDASVFSAVQPVCIECVQCIRIIHCNILLLDWKYLHCLYSDYFLHISIHKGLFNARINSNIDVYNHQDWGGLECFLAVLWLFCALIHIAVFFIKSEYKIKITFSTTPQNNDVQNCKF